jgi:CyaY protein
VKKRQASRENKDKLPVKPKIISKNVGDFAARRRPRACYTKAMLDEAEFRSLAEIALETLKQHLYVLEEDNDAGFEVEEQNGVLNVVFEKPEGKFVITPNAPVRQIWISALSTSFKLDWDELEQAFVLPRSGEALISLVDRLIRDFLLC